MHVARVNPRVSCLQTIPSAEIIPPSILLVTGSHHLGRFLTIFIPPLSKEKGTDISYKYISRPLYDVQMRQ